MAQTTGAMSARNAYVDFGTNGSSYTDCSGFANKVSVDGGDRDTGKAPTFDGDIQVLTRGKRDTYKVKLSVLYTEGGSDVATAARTAYRAGTDFYIRWAPKGNTTGNTRFTTTACTVVNGVFPETDTTSADPIELELELECADITDAAIP